MFRAAALESIYPLVRSQETFFGDARNHCTREQLQCKPVLQLQRRLAFPSPLNWGLPRMYCVYRFATRRQHYFGKALRWFEPQIWTPKTLVWPLVMSSHSVLLKSNSEPTCHIKWNPVQVSVCVMYICMCVCVCICVCMRGGLCVCVCICGCVKKNVRFFKKYVFSRLIPSCILSYVTLDTRDNLYASVRWHILETIGIFIISMLGYSRDSGRQHWCGKSEEVITAADYPVANQPTNQRREKGGPSERRRYVPKKITSLGTCPLVAWICRLTHQQHPTCARGFRHNFIKYAVLFFTSVLRNLGKHERLF